MTDYVRFTENNGWEGEAWHFFIPLDGNEKAIEELRDLVGALDDDEQETAFTVGGRLSDEAIGPLLNANEWEEKGYMPRFNLLLGKLTLPKRPSTDDEDGWNQLFETFYKGGIRKMMNDQ